MKPWTKEENDFLRANCESKSFAEMAESLGRSESSVRNHFNQVGFRTGRYLTEQEKQYIRDNVETMTFTDIGKHIGRRRQAIERFCKREGLKGCYRWSEEEYRYLDDFVGEKTAKRISQKLGRSTAGVHSKLYRENRGGFNENCYNHKVADLPGLLGWTKCVSYKRVAAGMIKSKRLGAYRLITEKSLIEFMRERPDMWDATEADYWQFCRYDWFQQKLKEDSRKKREKRWGCA